MKEGIFSERPKTSEQPGLWYISYSNEYERSQPWAIANTLKQPPPLMVVVTNLLHFVMYSPRVPSLATGWTKVALLPDSTSQYLECLPKFRRLILDRC